MGVSLRALDITHVLTNKSSLFLKSNPNDITGIVLGQMQRQWHECMIKHAIQFNSMTEHEQQPLGCPACRLVIAKS